VLYTNNPAIDANILRERIDEELGLLHAVERERDGPEPRAVPSTVSEAPAASLAVVQPQNLKMGLGDWIKRVPIVGAVAAWMVWILRVRRIARTAFDAEVGLANSKEQVSRIELQGDRLEQQIASLEPRIVNLESLTRAVDELRNQLRELRDELRESSGAVREQHAAIRHEVMFQQHRLSRFAGAMAKSEIASVEVATAVRDQRLDSLYEAFEDVYRGSRADIKQRLAVYIDRLKLTGAGQSETPVVDIGCGRGEWLELLKENGLAAYGIDVNTMMVERTISLGLDARVADLVEHLRSLDDRSRSAITAFHVVEHLPFTVVVDFLDESLRVLQPGGMLIIETPNPENMRVGATTFYIDPTHRNPILPDPLRFIVEHRGFTEVEILRLHPVPDSERLKGQGGDIAHLNALLFGPRDYAILARRL
jgi:O-antigen chain-terminating methyltransferase